MKKLLLAIICLWLALPFSLRADEGMWLLSLLNQNYEEMKAKGFQLTPEDIYSVNNASLKDAIGGLGNERMPFGFFCTAEVISDKGLMLTNHHCGYDAIQKHSAVDHDYLKDGFWAKTTQEELSNEGMCVSFLVSMADVTDSVLANVTEGMSEADRSNAIRKAIKAIEKEAKEGSEYGASVKNMFEGNRYYLFLYETYYDVRLVGAPPESIGKFGGDTDNWMWPRHTGDFSLMRVYTGPDGKPAKYSADNIPLKPKHSLPVSIKGIEKGDFAMVMGFPGSTERYLTSYGIEEALEITNPAAVKIRTKKLEMMRQGMDKSDKVRIQYASKYAQTANYWKYFIGQSKGLKRLDVYGKKKTQEEEFTAWVNQSEERKQKYGEALSLVSKHFAENKEKALANQYVFEALLQGGEVMMFPTRTMQFAKLLENSTDKQLIADAAAELKESSKDFYKDYNTEVDKNVARELLKLYAEDVPQEYQLDILKEINAKFKGDIDKFIDEVFAKSIFADEARWMAFLDKPSYKKLTQDWAYKIMESILAQYFKMQGGKGNTDLERGMRLYVAGLLEMKQDKKFYPDANSTIRLTYGTVGDYKPRDAVHYNYFTTIDGILEKEDPQSSEFVVVDKLKELYAKKDFGQYADKDNNLHVCFTTNNDITGGNSGSPVINGNGELIGCAFDGNWEAMSGDIAFEHELQKCINCDVRYILWVIEKIGGATNLIEEMNIVK